MALPSTLRQNNSGGFTLVETLIAVAILAIILSLGVFASFDIYQSYQSHSQIEAIVSILQKARSQSISNIHQASHGVRFEDNPSLHFILFECQSGVAPCAYVPNPQSDIVIEPSYQVLVTDTLPIEVVFGQLEGSCTSLQCSPGPLVINFMAAGKPFQIQVNRQGRIDW